MDQSQALSVSVPSTVLITCTDHVFNVVFKPALSLVTQTSNLFTSNVTARVGKFLSMGGKNVFFRGNNRPGKLFFPGQKLAFFQQVAKSSHSVQLLVSVTFRVVVNNNYGLVISSCQVRWTQAHVI